MVQRWAAQWVSDMLEKLGWRTLEQRRADSRLVLFCKIVHECMYVAVPLPSYVIPLTRISRTSRPLAYRQIYARTDYYKYSFFRLAVVQWNALPAPTATLTASSKLSARCDTWNHKPFLSSLFFLLFDTIMVSTFIHLLVSRFVCILNFFRMLRGAGT